MARASDDICPICLDTLCSAAWAEPCHHRFCFSCIWRWMEIKPECPLCKRTVISTQLLQQGDNFEMFPRRPSAASLDGAREEGPHQAPAATALGMRQQWNLYLGFTGGLHPSTWGFLFGTQHPDLLQPLCAWLHWELGDILGQERSQALRLEEVNLNALPILGLHEERLAQQLQTHLQSRTTAFVQRLSFTVEQCRRAAQRLLLRGDSQAARDLEESPRDVTCSAVFRRWWDRSPVVGSSWAAYQERREGNLMASTSPTTSPGRSPAPGAAPSSSPAAGDADELPGPSAAALQGRPGCPSPVPAPTPGQQEEPSREPGVAAADASAPGQARACSCQAPQRPVKRKVTTSEDAGTPAKKPPPQ